MKINNFTCNIDVIDFYRKYIHFFIAPHHSPERFKVFLENHPTLKKLNEELNEIIRAEIQKQHLAFGSITYKDDEHKKVQQDIDDDFLEFQREYEKAVDELYYDKDNLEDEDTLLDKLFSDHPELLQFLLDHDEKLISLAKKFVEEINREYINSIKDGHENGIAMVKTVIKNYDHFNGTDTPKEFLKTIVSSTWNNINTNVLQEPHDIVKKEIENIIQQKLDELHDQPKSKKRKLNE